MVLFSVVAGAISVSCSVLPRNWTRRTQFSTQDLYSENPVIQVKAIHQIVERKDQTAVPELIQLMLHEEPSIRNQAYWGVTQLTGLEKPSPEAVEYHAYDSLEERKKSVQAWAEFWSKRGTP